jgi:hypothetical protein
MTQAELVKLIEEAMNPGDLERLLETFPVRILHFIDGSDIALTNEDVEDFAKHIAPYIIQS